MPMNPIRLLPAVVLCSLCACSGIPDLGSMVGQMALGANPGTDRFGSRPDNNIPLPDGYRFSYRVTMRITTDQGTVDRVFYAQPDAHYYARRESRDGFTEFLVYDNENDLIVRFAEMDGEMRRMHDRMNLETKAALVGAYRDAPDREIRPVDGKTILGYSAAGYEISTLAGTTRLWVTDQAPATLYRAMFEGRTGASSDAPLSEDSMIMEASFTSAYTPEKNYHMEVTQIEPDTVVLSTRDYTG